jgi:hypothetical protein
VASGELYLNSEIIVPKGGRSTRWCSEGCKRSGEDEMSRLSSLLKTYEEGRAWDRLNGYRHETRDGIIADLQARYDHLAGARPAC